MIIKEDLAVKAKFFRGLSDSTRLAILESIVNGEKTVGEVVKITKQSQSNVSNHLKCLSDCGLVKSRRKGKNIYYSIRNQNIKKLLKTSELILSEVYSDIAACERYKERRKNL